MKNAPDNKNLTEKPLRFSVNPVVEPIFKQKIKVRNEKELLAVSRELAKRLTEEPEFSIMLFANPVLALRAYGFELSKMLEHHVLTSLRHPPILRNRRAELEASLEKKLGSPPNPTNPKWLAELVHVQRKLKPCAVEVLKPAYKPHLSAGRVAAIRARHPAATNRYPEARRIKVRHRMGVAPAKDTIRRLDLDAELSELPSASAKAKSLTLEEAWFYKDDPVVRDAVELGIIIKRGFPFATPAEFRKIAKGESVDGFRAFIDTVGVKNARKSAEKSVHLAARPKAKSRIKLATERTSKPK